MSSFVLSSTLAHLLHDRARATPSAPLFSDRLQGRWVSRTAQDLLEEAELFASGLLGLELTPRARVAIICPSQWEWVAIAAGATLSRLVAFAIPVELDPEKQVELLNRSKAEVVFVTSNALLERLCSDSSRLNSIKRVISLTSSATTVVPLGSLNVPKDWIMPLEKLRAQGRRQLTRSPKKLEKLLGEIKPEDPAVDLVTAGSSPTPRIVTLTHRDWCEKLRLVSTELFPHVESAGERLYSFLPLSSVWGQFELWGSISLGFNKYFGASRSHLQAELVETRPTLVFGTPEFYEQLRDLLELRLQNDSWWRRELRSWTSRARHHQDVSRRWWHTSRWRAEGKLATNLAFRHLRKLLGSRVKMLFCGGASASQTQLRFFDQIGLPLLEVYGLTEAAGPISLSLPNKLRLGSPGKPLPHYAIKTSEDGEILFMDRSRLDSKWSGTGDLGYLDAEGYLHVLERKSDVLTLSSGQTISPRKIEKTLTSYRIVSQAVVLGERQPYVSALIRLNTEALIEFASHHDLVFSSLDSLLRHPIVESLVQKTLEEVNRELEEAERVKKFALLKRDLSTESGELNPLSLPRRGVISRHFREEFEQLYSSP